jgi:hypothetical protein
MLRAVLAEERMRTETVAEMSGLVLFTDLTGPLARNLCIVLGSHFYYLAFTYCMPSEGS